MFFQLVFFLSIEFKFSVVMATYNTKNYVKQAIESVINQTIGFENNIQLILINDGSDDGTGDILLNYKNLYPIISGSLRSTHFCANCKTAVGLR